MRLLPIILGTLMLAGCASHKDAALRDLAHAQSVLTHQRDTLDSASANLATAKTAALAGAPPEEIASAIVTASAQVDAARADTESLVGTTSDLTSHVANLQDPPNAWLKTARVVAYAVLGLVILYVLWRFVSPLWTAVLPLLSVFIPKPKKDLGTLAAKVDAGSVDPAVLVTAVRSDRQANAAYVAAQKRGKTDDR